MYVIEVKRVLRHNRDTVTLYFSENIHSYPGQFIMLTLFGYEEIPLSLSSPSSVTVKVIGETTRALYNLEPGTKVGVRGPFGRGFTPTIGKCLIVAGGIGVAPMLYLYDFLKKMGCEITFIYGVKTREDIIFREKIEKDLLISTEDGSEGYRGTVVDLIKGLKINKYHRIYCCGPEGMLRSLYIILKSRNMLEKTEFSLERYIKCGIGICGSCVIRGGKRICKDGPVFRVSEISNEYE